MRHCESRRTPAVCGAIGLLIFDCTKYIFRAVSFLLLKNSSPPTARSFLGSCCLLINPERAKDVDAFISSMLHQVAM